MSNQFNSRIIAHRGCWAGEGNFNQYNKNGIESLDLALKSGFGIEIDIRDHCGQIYISHDPILDKNNCVEFDSIFEKVSDQILALNIKSDGLLNLLEQKGIEKLRSKNHFFFDLSFPEEIKYRKLDQKIANRVSEYETFDFKRGNGIEEYYWLDAFINEWWIKDDLILEILKTKSQIVVVSPELHGRNPKIAWQYLKGIWPANENLLVCTDYPFELCGILEK